MTTAATPASTAAVGAMPTPRQQFLDAYEREHATTMKILRAFPADQSELRPHAKMKTARELAYVFVRECGLGIAGLNDAIGKGQTGPSSPPVPEKWDDVLSALELAHVAFRQAFDSYTDAQLLEPIKFFVAPKTIGDYSRLQFAWFLLCDQIHHRGQMSVYLRMADGKVPSIYGPTADEPWR
jgi:DinB family protein